MKRSSSPILATRVERLERLSARMWANEPPVGVAERTRLLRQLGDIERRLAAISLQLIVDPSTDDQLEESLQRCERRIEEMLGIWAIPADERLLAS
jgi:hypothetical protein